MISQTSDTALLLFTRSARQEAACKNFFSTPNKRFNEQIAQQLIDRTIKIAFQTSLPFFIIDEKLQRGSGFGTRLSNALEDVFKKGFKKIIVIGNDCPLLSAPIINEASFALQNADLLLAPTSKGGVYLIGLTKKRFEKSRFEKLNWQTERVFENMTRYAAERNICVQQLPCLNDINNDTDLKATVFTLSITDPLRKIITSLLASLQIVFCTKNISLCLQHPFFSKGLRAPPLC